MAAAIDVPVEAVLATEAQTWPERARALLVVDPQSYERAGEALRGIKGLRARIEESFGPIVSAAHAAWKEACNQRTKLDAPLTEAEGILKRSIAAFYDAEEKKRFEEAKRIREENDRLALLAREAEIEEAEAEGASVEEITVIAERPVYVPPVQAVRQAPKAAGVAMTQQWKAEVTDKRALLKYVVANPQYLNLVEPNMSAIGTLARALKDTMNVPGLKVYPVTGVAARRA